MSQTIDPFNLKEMSHYRPETWPYIVGYALALDDMMFKQTGESPSGKSYDPMMIEAGVFHSYAFDMKDGGRHHPFSDYENVKEVLSCLLREAVEWVNEDE